MSVRLSKAGFIGMAAIGLSLVLCGCTPAGESTSTSFTLKTSGDSVSIKPVSVSDLVPKDEGRAPFALAVTNTSGKELPMNSISFVGAWETMPNDGCTADDDNRNLFTASKQKWADGDTITMCATKADEPVFLAFEYSDAAEPGTNIKVNVTSLIKAQ